MNSVSEVIHRGRPIKVKRSYLSAAAAAAYLSSIPLTGPPEANELTRLQEETFQAKWIQ